MVTLSVIVPTLGRATLARTLDSILSQLSLRDEVIVAPAPGADMVALAGLCESSAITLLDPASPAPGRGAGERNAAMKVATGSHLVFMDDDDVYLHGALDVMRAAACDRPVMFRMDATNVGIGIKWVEPEVRYGNVSTQMFVVPNDPGRLGTWAPHQGTEGSDFTFIKGCCERMGDPVWREEIVAVLRPLPTVTVVTPWMDHLELADDYLAAIGDGDPDELIVVDNGSTPPLPFDGIRFEENRGFAPACNAGLARAATDAVVFLNNDIALTRPGWLHAILRALEPGVLVGAQMRQDSHADVDGYPMPYLDGWCLAGMRSDLLDLGGFDETYLEPSYFGDNDLCLRARAAGMSLREVRVGLRHKLNATSGGSAAPGVREATTANRARYLERARDLLTPASDETREGAAHGLVH